MARTKKDYLVIRENGTPDLYTGDHAEQQAADAVEDVDRVYAGRGLEEYRLTSIRRLLPAEAPAPKKAKKPRKARPAVVPPAPEGDE
jgi:hypothetical protein